MKGTNSMQKVQTFLKTFVASLALVLAFGVALQPNVAAEELTITNGASSAKGDEQGTNLFGDNSYFKTITNTLLFLIGAVSVIMLVYGGIRYTVSGGDESHVKAAKNTILYAIVGIVVALLAYAVVNFVITQFVANGS